MPKDDLWIKDQNFILKFHVTQDSGMKSKRQRCYSHNVCTDDNYTSGFSSGQKLVMPESFLHVGIINAFLWSEMRSDYIKV